MPLKQILKTLYAPHKAFKEIAQSPKYLGPLLILVILVVANVAFTYAATSKTYMELSIPTGEKLDEWTENSTLWTPNAETSNDSITGGYFGDVSISYTVANATQVGAELDNIGPLNCSSPDEYNKLSFSVKLTSPQESPVSMTVKLFSSSDYFSLNPAMAPLNLTKPAWNNVTVPLNTSDWSSSSPAADWERITGFRLELAWNANSNITLLVDGLFFHGPIISLFENAGSFYMVNYAMQVFMQFIVTWVILSGLVYMLTKAFGGKLVWKPLLILVGFALVTMFVQVLINVIVYANLLNVHYPFELLAGIGENQAIADTINSQTWAITYIQRFMQIAVWIWTTALTTLAVRLLAAISWFKSGAVASISYFVALLVRSIIAG